LASFLVIACNLTSSRRWPASLSSALGDAHSTWTVVMGVYRPTAPSFEAHWPLESTKGLGALTLQVALAASRSSASSRVIPGLSGSSGLDSVSGFIGTSVTRKSDPARRSASRSFCNRLGSF